MLINNRYQIESEINRGAFGVIYRGTDRRSNRTDLISEQKVAIKIELPHSLASLKYEVKILTYLKTNKIKNVPDIFWYGNYNRVPCLVMTYYEYSLYDYCVQFPIEIDTEKINNWIFQLVDIIEQFHKVYLLHRDIKPNNIMIKGEGIYLIDFGLSTFYLDENREHIKDYQLESEENRLIGSLKFASIFLHQGHRYSRRDDFISIVYLFGYLLLGGETPWFNPEPKITEQNKTKDTFMTIIRSSHKEESFDWTPFQYFCDYCYQLKYEEIPAYASIKQLFANR